MARQKRPGQPAGGSGGGGGGNGGKVWGALLGGGGDNPNYKGADAGGSNMAAMQNYYEFPENYSAPPVSGKAMEATYRDVGKTGIDNPYKQLNWIGKATGQPDPYTQFRTFQAESGISQQQAIGMEGIRNQHALEAQAIENSNLTERQKQQAHLESDLRMKEKAQAGNVGLVNKYGFVYNPENQAAVNTATAPLIPEMAPKMIMGDFNAQAANTALATANANRAQVMQLGPNESAMHIGRLLSPGMGVTNVHPSDQAAINALGMGQAAPFSGLRYDLNGRAIQQRPPGPTVSATPVDSPGNAGLEGSPNAFAVDNPAVQLPAMQPTIAPPVAAAGPAAAYAPLIRGLQQLYQSIPSMYGFGQGKAPEPPQEPPVETEEMKRRRLSLTPSY